MFCIEIDTVKDASHCEDHIIIRGVSNKVLIRPFGTFAAYDIAYYVLMNVEARASRLLPGYTS